MHVAATAAEPCLPPGGAGGDARAPSVGQSVATGCPGRADAVHRHSARVENWKDASSIGSQPGAGEARAARWKVKILAWGWGMDEAFLGSFRAPPSCPARFPVHARGRAVASPGWLDRIDRSIDQLTRRRSRRYTPPIAHAGR